MNKSSAILKIVKEKNPDLLKKEKSDIFLTIMDRYLIDCLMEFMISKISESERENILEKIADNLIVYVNDFFNYKQEENK